MARQLKGGAQALSGTKPRWWTAETGVGLFLFCQCGGDSYRVRIPGSAVLDQAVRMIEHRIKVKRYAAAY